MIDENLTYRGNVHIKRDGAQVNYTQDQILEYKKCMESPQYFAENYIKVIHLDHGLVPFKLYPYQSKMFDHFNNNRFAIVLACRQSGKSISSLAYLLWYAMFHSEQTVAILANKGSTAREMVGRITLMMENLPFWLQPGCKAANKSTIEFSNNSRIISAATSSSSIRGFSINLLYLDEFAFVENATEFYTSTYPVVSSGKTSRVIITSTANGIGNLYHKIWESAVQETSEYKPFRVDWWDVPGRDEEWKRMTVANTSELQFEQEFGNAFHGTGNTLFNGQCLLELRAEDPIFDRDGLRQYRTVEEGHRYVIFVDVAKGRGMDYSTFNVIDLSTDRWEQVCVYQDNIISPLLFPDKIVKWAKYYNDAYIVVESNDQGAVVCNGIYYDWEYENMFIQSSVKADALGVMMDKKVKRIGCSHIKDIVEQGKLVVRDKETIIEMSTFVAKGQSYEASDDNHDDLVMNLVLFGWFANTPWFLENTDINIKDQLFRDHMKAIENDMIPFGIMPESDIVDPLEERDRLAGWERVQPSWMDDEGYY